MKEKNSKLFVYGINVAREVLSNQAHNVLEIYILQGKTTNEVDFIAQTARKAKMIVRSLPDKKFREYVGPAKHQGIILKMKSFEYVSLDQILENTKKENPSILIMEQLEDPHNVGAIIRSATAMGVAGIVMLNHHQAPVNATSYKTSAGTIGRIPICRVGNIANVIQTLKKKKYWIAGLDMEGESVVDNHQISDSPMAFIVGNEGSGLKESTRNACDFLISIPMENNIESLNASVSAAIIMYEWRRMQSVS